MDSVIGNLLNNWGQMNLYPVDNTTGFPTTDPLDSDLIIVLQIALSNFLIRQGHMFVLWTYFICFKLNVPVFSFVFLGLYHDCEWFSFSDGS